VDSIPTTTTFFRFGSVVGLLVTERGIPLSVDIRMSLNSKVQSETKNRMKHIEII
jgi:hypothetical protein